MKVVILIMIGWIFYNVDCISQDTAVYIAKCKEHNRLKKYNCITLKLLPRDRFEYSDIAVDLPLAIYKGKCAINGDTITVIAENFDKEMNITRKKNDKDFFNIKFIGFSDYPVVIDSIKVYDKGVIIKKANRINSVSFSDADSADYFVDSRKFKVLTNLNDYKQNRSIKISLPIDYYIRKGKNILIGYYTKIKLEKINVP